MFIVFVLVLVVFAVIAFQSLVVIKHGEYVVVYRLGQIVRWHGPGAIVVIPFIERVVRIPLHQITNWQTMPQDELEKKVIAIALKMQLGMWP